MHHGRASPLTAAAVAEDQVAFETGAFLIFFRVFDARRAAAAAEYYMQPKWRGDGQSFL